MTDPDYILDLGGTKRPGDSGAGPCDGASGDPAAGKPAGRPFISIHFTCCNVFARVYANAAGTAYVGWCPKCARKVTARIGPDGTNARIFTAR